MDPRNVVLSTVIVSLAIITVAWVLWMTFHGVVRVDGDDELRRECVRSCSPYTVKVCEQHGDVMTIVCFDKDSGARFRDGER